MSTTPAWGDAPEPLRFERRNGSRWPLEGEATAFCLAPESFGQIHELHLMDGSDHGIGAQCDTAIPPGTVVSLGFSIHGFTARQGTVVRCLPCGDGYRVAVRFQRRMAA